SRSPCRCAPRPRARARTPSRRTPPRARGRALRRRCDAALPCAQYRTALLARARARRLALDPADRDEQRYEKHEIEREPSSLSARRKEEETGRDQSEEAGEDRPALPG